MKTTLVQKGHPHNADSPTHNAPPDLGRRGLIAAAVAAVGGAAIPVTAQDNRSEAGAIGGSWYGTLTTPLGEVSHLISFHDDGIVIASARQLVTPTPFGDLLESPAHGAWRRTGPRTFDVFLRLFLQHADTGLLFGTDNVRFTLVLARDGGTLAGTFVVQGKDTADVLVFEFSGDYMATRITV